MLTPPCRFPNRYCQFGAPAGLGYCTVFPVTSTCRFAFAPIQEFRSPGRFGALSFFCFALPPGLPCWHFTIFAAPMACHFLLQIKRACRFGLFAIFEYQPVYHWPVWKFIALFHPGCLSFYRIDILAGFPFYDSFCRFSRNRRFLDLPFCHISAPSGLPLCRFYAILTHFMGKWNAESAREW